MASDNVKKTLKNFIERGNHDELFLNLSGYLSNEKLANDVSLIQANFNSWKRRERNGTVEDKEFQLNINKLNGRLIELIDSISEKDIIPSLIDDELEQNHIDDTDFKLQLKRVGLLRKLNSKKGNYTYKRNFVKFRNTFEEKLIMYSGLSNYKYSWESNGERFISKIGNATIHVLFCPQFMLVEVIKKDDFDEFLEKTLDKFTLDLDHNFEFVWIKEATNKKYTSDEISKIVLKKTFTWIIEDEFW